MVLGVGAAAGRPAWSHGPAGPRGRWPGTRCHAGDALSGVPGPGHRAMDRPRPGQLVAALAAARGGGCPAAATPPP